MLDHNVSNSNFESITFFAKASPKTKYASDRASLNCYSQNLTSKFEIVTGKLRPLIISNSMGQVPTNILENI